jgi:hypothetical protein
MQQEDALRIRWPMTIVAVLVAAAICIAGVILGTRQTVPPLAARPWRELIAGYVPSVVLPSLIVGAFAWIIERNIKDRRRDEHRGFDVVHRDDDSPPAA